MTVRQMQVLFENLLGQYNKEMIERMQTDEVEIFLNHAQTKLMNREFVEIGTEEEKEKINNKLGKFRKLTKVIKAITPIKTISRGAITGTYTVGETITGGTSFATGILLEVGTGTLILRNISGTFASGETLTGGTSSAFSTSSSLATPYNYTSIPNSVFFSLESISDFMYYIFGTVSATRSDKSGSAFTVDCTLINIENAKDFINNDFNKPYIRSPYTALLENGIITIYDPETTINSLDITYLRSPKKLTSFTLSGVYANYVNTCELPEEMHEELVTIAVQSAIAVKDPAKYQVAINESRETDI